MTLFGRRRPVPELSSSNFMQRSFGERVAMNAPIQGTFCPNPAHQFPEAQKGQKSDAHPGGQGANAGIAQRRGLQGGQGQNAQQRCAEQQNPVRAE
ncbi:DNA polymerase [Hafnia paralvei]|uniref:DNA polymerase n=1 Tax=Hafnia paralvei TaxID=546367 RepID=UPI003D0BD145